MSKAITGSFDQIADALQGVDGRVTLTGLEQAEWSLEACFIGRLSLQVGHDGAPNFYQGACESDSLILFVPLAEPQFIRVNGKELDSLSLVTIAPCQSVTVTSAAPNRYAVCTIPIELLTGSRQFDDDDIAALATSNRARTFGTDWASNLRNLLRRLISEDWGSMSGPAARRAEEELLSLVVHASHSRNGQVFARRGRPAISRHRVVAKALERVEGSQGDMPFLEDLCHAADVSERTLRSVFNEYFGVGPIRYLRLHRLHRIRAALCAAQQGRDTVASIVSGFGVWDFGHFAREYRAAFGESPSQTLRGEGHVGK